MNTKIDLKYKILFVLIIIIILGYIFVLKPFLTFRKMEEKFLDSGKRYYEINSSKLPTGKRINKLYLKELYDKSFVEEDYKKLIIDNKCSLENSFIRVYKKDNNYNYDAYLECCMWKSKIDHEGPVINLNGNDEINLYKDEKYKELGVKNVVDDTDGTIDIKNVEIDSSKVKTSKVGTYQVTYKVKDSYNNVTIKTRTIKVTETLNHIVSSQTKNKNIYTGSQSNNYLMLDGIIFRIVGLNADKTVKVVTDTPISAVNYNDVNAWLNDYFYNKFSDSAKEYIVKSSKWCIDNVADTSNYTKCNKYSKKSPIGLLSVLDINNSKDESGVYMLNGNTLLYNLKDNKTSYLYTNNSLYENSVDDNIVLTPVLNIVEDAIIVSGDGTLDDPFRLKGNKTSLKPGDKISDAKIGEYFTYSGYTWRVIGKEDDNTTKVIMDGVLQKDAENYYLAFTDTATINFNPSKKKNIGYSLANEVSSYLKTGLFVSKKIDYPKYSKEIGYKANKKSNSNKLKINIPSMYDLFSTSYIDSYYWYKEYSNDKYCYMYYLGNVKCSKYDFNDMHGIRVIAYLNDNVKVEKGKGLMNNQYVLAAK